MALCGSMALGNPGIMYEFICKPYMPGNQAVYRALVADLGATPQQCQRSSALVQDHAAAMRQLQESEQHLLASMQVTGPWTGGWVPACLPAHDAVSDAVCGSACQLHAGRAHNWR